MRKDCLTWTLRPTTLVFAGGQTGILRRGPSAVSGQLKPGYLNGLAVPLGGEFNTSPLFRETNNRSDNMLGLLMQNLNFTYKDFLILILINMSVHCALKDKTEQIKRDP